MRRYLAVWLALTAVVCLLIHQWVRIPRGEAPPHEVERWAFAALEAARTGAPAPVAPATAESFHPRGRVLVRVWSRGRIQARHDGDKGFAATVRAAAESFARDETLAALPGWQGDRSKPVHFTITVVEGEGPLVLGLPYLSSLSLVPLVEGVFAERGAERVELTPDEITAARLWDSAVSPPIPDLSFGVNLEHLVGQLAGRLGVDASVLLREGRVGRFRARTLLAAPYPARRQDAKVDVVHLERAAREGAEFLIGHQRRDGRYTYIYQADRDRAQQLGYNMPRHAGTTFFLAQAARELKMPEAREAALRALRWIQRERLARCGAPERLCVLGSDVADIGSAALTALAASEVLRGGEDALTRELLEGLVLFIRSMQRPDGELMHIYDVQAGRPIDIQKMYYSGEAAFALFKSQSVLPDAQNLATAKRLMSHLTGSAWDFFGSRYFYGEEHWTCQAVAEAAAHMPVEGAMDFCRRWLAFQRQLLYHRGDTPWPVEGAIGVGPVILPRFTAVASRSEAGAAIYRVARAREEDVGPLRTQLEASLGLLLRMRWAPGPAHLMPDPSAAFGGLPGTQVSLESRNDFVQHAGSAMLSWARILREEGG